MITKFIQLFKGMPDNLSRVTSGSRFIPEIDGLRFLAIIPVVLMHFSERVVRTEPSSLNSVEHHVAAVLDNGHIGVYLFFAISGFILALPFGLHKLHHKKPVSLKQYFLRRLTRLEPPYLVIMSLLFLILVFMQGSLGELFPHYLVSLIYQHRLIYGTWSPINPPTWTLEIEVYFYIIAPFLSIAYFSISNKWVRRLTLILLIVLKIVVANTTDYLDSFYLMLPYAIQYFLIGILFADIFLTEWKEGVPKNRLYDIITPISIIVLFSSWTWEKNLTWKFVFMIALFFTMYGTFRSISFNKIARNRWITAIGGMCYTIYLIHLAFAEFFVLLLRKLPIPDISFVGLLLGGLILFLPALFVISSLFFLSIEKPCMDPLWPQKLKAWSISKFYGTRNQRS